MINFYVVCILLPAHGLKKQVDVSRSIQLLPDRSEYIPNPIGVTETAFEIHLENGEQLRAALKDLLKTNFSLQGRLTWLSQDNRRNRRESEENIQQKKRRSESVQGRPRL